MVDCVDLVESVVVLFGMIWQFEIVFSVKFECFEYCLIGQYCGCLGLIVLFDEFGDVVMVVFGFDSCLQVWLYFCFCLLFKLVCGVVVVMFMLIQFVLLYDFLAGDGVG